MYGLYKKATVDQEGNISDEVRITQHQDINELYWFKGKHNYTDDDYCIYEIEQLPNGEWQTINGTEL